jgi:hypothetical protein
MQVQPYLFFDGRCEEAIAFYKVSSEGPILPPGVSGCF